MKLGVVSLGCDKATVDSERVVGNLVGHGAKVVADPAGADVILINTCGFIDAAKRESIDAILEAAALKEQGRVNAVVVVGCLVQRYRAELAAEMPEVDLFLGFRELPTLVPELVARGLLGENPAGRHPGVRQYVGEGPHVRYLKISEGCDHTCAFCAIPLMRGKHRSEPLERLVAEAQELERQGAKEINLVAQDLGHYGRDLGRSGPKLPELLDALLTETSVPWFRLLYVYSAGLSEGLVSLMARQPRVVPYIDIPIQHGSDRMLERMRRPERQDTIRKKVAWLRGAVPDIAIRSTALVGFPGERDEDFRTLCDFADEVGFERLGVFAFSPQDGTRAAEYEDDVPDEVQLEREQELLELQRAISSERLSRFVGREVDLLVDEITDPDLEGVTHVGRVVWQADDVDGVTRLSAGGWAGAGDIMKVRITSSEDFDFRAVPAS